MGGQRGWVKLADKPLVFARSYSFGKATANALVVALPNDKLLIVSPPTRASAEELRELESHGEVIALLANNGLHHLGLAPCRAVFPNAISYAAPLAAQRIRKKGKEPGQLLSPDQLKPLLGDQVTVLQVPDGKIGDLMVRVRTDKGVLLYAGDLIANMPSLPPALVPRLLFKLTNSAPGLKLFNFYIKLFIKNRKAALAFLLKEIEANPPTILVPAHGDVLARDDLPSDLRTLLSPALA